jgi:DNA-binding PadR family transcriptional regulator
MVDRLGGFEELVLLAVAGLRGTGYGVTIQEQLEAETGRGISVGAVYATLDRLERKGYVQSRLGPATAERGGRRKRLYRATALGATALAQARRVRLNLWNAIEAPAR